MSTGAGTGAALLTASAASLTVVMSASRTAAADPVAFAERGLAPALTGLVLGTVVLVPVAVWLIRSRLAALGLVLAGIATAAPMWAAWPGLPDQVRAGALALTPAAVAGIGVCGVYWTTGVPAGARLLVGTSSLFALAAVLVHLGGYSPFADLGCSRTCVAVAPVLGSVVSTRTAVAIAGGLTLLASGAAVLALVRAAGTPGVLRLAAMVGTIWLSVVAAARWVAWGDSETSGLLVVLVPLAPAVVAVAACSQAIRVTRTRRAAGRLVDSLASTGASTGIQYAVPGTDRWVDGSGIETAQTPRSIVLSDESGPAIRVAIPPRSEETEFVAALRPAIVLAMRNAQLSAAAVARAADVRASQRRVVVASDTERHRIERDLHDGAQQRLVSVLFQLRLLAKDVDPGTRAELVRIERNLTAVLARLRELAHGTPGESLLAAEGLRAALEELVASSELHPTLDLRLDGHVDREAEWAAYATVAAALAAGRTYREGGARVAVRNRDGVLTVKVLLTAGDPGSTSFIDVRDRLGALGGRLDVRSDDHEICVEAVVPCVS